MRLLVNAGTCAFGVVVMIGCATPLQVVPVDSNVNFAAHIEHRGLVIDQMAGTSAVLAPAGSLPFSDGPRFLLQQQGKTIAALWFQDPGHMIVRQTADPQSPLIGEVDAAWKEGSIRLTLKPAGGPAFQTGEFARTDGRLSSATLGRDATTVLDVRGTYRAELRDSTGAPVGWLRLQVSTYQGVRRIYDGVLPASLNGPLATAAAAVLNSEVRYIRNQALNVYQGN